MSTKENTTKVLRISQAADFSCTGPACEDTCCSGWSIPVDSLTLEKWSEHPGFSVIEKRLNIVNEKEKSHACAATIKQNDKNDNCMFLDGDRLCLLQKNYGHEFLGYTCKKYPREESRVDLVPEMSLTLSCPESARLQLSTKDGLNLDLHDVTDTPGPFFRTVISKDSPPLTSGNRLALRVFALGMIQNRKFSVCNRLILLGLFSEALQKELSMPDSSPEGVAESFRKLQESSDNSSISSLFKDAPRAFEKKLEFSTILLKTIEPYSKRHAVYNSFFTSWMNAVNFKISESSIDSSVYKKCRQEYLSGFTFDYILENYLFHRVFSVQFPVKNNSTLEEFFKIALAFCLIREHIIGMYHNPMEVNENRIITLIQSFTRNHDHAKALQKSIHDILDAAEINSLAHFCILIND
jgi:lysine-N-methylase